MTDNGDTRGARDIKSIVPDPAALKALSHRDRLRMLGLLRIEGPATASGLAGRMGLNSGATSYHLRQLHRHGFIEPAPDMGNRRERWWRAAHDSTSFEIADASGDALAAGMAMSQAILAVHAQQMQMAHDRFGDLPREWRRASTASDFNIALSAADAEALVEKLVEVLWEAKAREPEPGTELGADMRRFTLMLHAFPHPGIPGDQEDEDEARA